MIVQVAKSLNFSNYRRNTINVGLEHNLAIFCQLYSAVAKSFLTYLVCIFVNRQLQKRKLFSHISSYMETYAATDGMLGRQSLNLMKNWEHAQAVITLSEFSNLLIHHSVCIEHCVE